MTAVWCISYILFYSVHVHSFFFTGKIETIGYGFIGETLNMTCNITDPSIKKNASDIKFTFNDTELNNTFIMGEKSKKLVLQLSGPQMNTAHIYCQVSNPSFTLIGSKIINVEYAPQNITNISCVNHGWDVFMYCSWSHPVEYLNLSNIQITSRWRSQYLDYVDCSKSYSYCNLTEGSYFSNKYMTISVEVKNTRLNVATTGTFDFDANKIVKPPPLEEINYEILNSTCILLNWKNVRPQRIKNVNVTYESEWKDTKEIVRYLVVEKDDYVNRTLCGLFPYTKYTFNFTVYPEYDGYASETISISTEKTRSSVPFHSPNTTGGAMYYKTQDCQQGNLRNVTIYWQVLEEKNWFGVPRGVSIQYNETGVLKTTPVLWNISSYTMQLDCNHAYYISITAENDAGPSFPPSFLRVPKYEPDFQPPMAKVEVPKEGNTSLVYVSWNVAWTLDQSKVEATVFWCKKSVGSICEGQVNWKKCSSTCLVSTDSPDQYTFGVSIETNAENTVDRRSTGLQWEECIYIKDKKPEISPKLTLISASEDKTLSVQWTRLTCQSANPFIIKYTVYYCKSHENKCKGITNQKIMQPEENFLKLNNLEAEQEYGFWVTASSEWGEGPTSEWVYGTPVDNNLNAGEIVGIVIGGLFVMVLAVSGAVFIIRHVKRKAFTPPPIEVPETCHIYSNLVIVPEMCHVYSDFVMDDKDEKDDNEKEDTIDSLPNGLSEKFDRNCMRQLSKDSGFAEEHKNRNSEEEEEKEPVTKEKEKELDSKTVSLPEDYIRVEGHGYVGSSPMHVPETTLGFVESKIQSPQVEKILEPEEPTYVKSDIMPLISSYIKCNSEPTNEHSVKASDNIEDVKTHKQLEVTAVNGDVEGNGNSKSSPHPQTIQADSIAQSQPDVNNYVSNVTVPESKQAAGNSMDQSSVSNCISSNKAPQTGSEGQSVVSDYVTSVPQPQQMCADRSTSDQQAVSGYVSNVMNSFPLSGNSSLASLTNDTCSQPMSTSKNTQCQSSDTGYVTSIPSPWLPPANNESQLQPAVNDHVLNTQSMSVDSDNHNQPALRNYAHDVLNAEPAELCDEYQATQDIYIRDTTIMQQVSMDVNPHDQTSVSNYVTSVTNPQPGSE